ncbi:MAG TPA: hypothetical protein VM008_16640 [Phycisphaerae bacterium]|nr:hypothetical protein [Phycisphaerae bacterium]
MGCCLFAIIGAIWPRLALIFIYLFTTLPQLVFKTTLWPLLGFLFVPTTTLAYELCVHYLGRLEDNLWSLLIVLLAFLHDLTQLGLARRPAR